MRAAGRGGQPRADGEDLKIGNHALVDAPIERDTGQQAAEGRFDRPPPAQAIHAGADLLVVGRPVTHAADVAAAAAAVADEVAAALAGYGRAATIRLRNNPFT